MNCDDFVNSLADFLEQDMPESTRAAMEAHAHTCTACGPLLADMYHLRSTAANLPELEPSHDLWAGISARIEAPVVALNGATNTGVRYAGAAGAGRTPFVFKLWLGLAAAGLIAVTATITREITRRSFATTLGISVAAQGATPTSPMTTVATTTPAHTTAPGQRSAVVPAPHSATRAIARTATSARLASNKAARRSAEQTYDFEIAKLRAVLDYRRRDLDSGTVAVVDKNLKIIDDAIAQCRMALQKDPASRFLMESLNDALDDKVQLLRTAATLPSRS